MPKKTEAEEKAVEIEVIPGQQRAWKPVTAVGRLVNEGVITSMEDIFAQGHAVLEAEIVNKLVPDLQEDLLLIGQAKGKFGGGQRRIFRQTQKKTAEGNRVHFTTCALIGNKNGYVGIGMGKSKETVPSRDKAKRNARVALIRVRRGCGSWECNCKQPHSIPYAVKGKCGSAVILLRPAPKGKGLVVDKEVAKVLAMAGIKDIWSKTFGQTKTKMNLLQAVMDALRTLSRMKIKPADIERLGIIDGMIKSEVMIKETEEVIRASPEIPQNAGALEIHQEVHREAHHG